MSQIAIADAEARLLTIRDAHRMRPEAGGMVSGYCPECERKWPCPTYLWTFDTLHGGPDAHTQPWEPDEWDPPRDEFRDTVPG